MNNKLIRELKAMMRLQTGDSFTAEHVHTLVNGILEGVGKFKYVKYDSTSFPYPQKIGDTADSIVGLGYADENMIDTIFIMPNQETDSDATLMIVIDEVTPSTDPKTYQYVYVGDINDLPSDVLTEESIINDLTSGGTKNPLSAEQGITLNSHVNYITCGSGASNQVKLISNDGFELSTHLRLLVKMTHTNTHATPKFNINNTGIKDVWYNGSVASNINTWRAGEVLDIYYDGTNERYIANTHGGAQFATGEKIGDVGIDETPTANSQNLVESEGIYNAINLFSNSIVNAIVKELYVPGVDYTKIAKVYIRIASLGFNGNYYNRVWLYNTDESSIKIYDKEFNTEQEAVVDVVNMNGIYNLNGVYSLLSVDDSLIGTAIAPDGPCTVSRDISNIANAPTISLSMVNASISGKQDVINDLSTIRAGAADGTSAKAILDGEGGGTTEPISTHFGYWNVAETPPLYISPEDVPGADEYSCNVNAVRCVPGEQFVITGKGSSYQHASSRLWAFTDQQGNVIARSEIGETRENYTLTVPTGATYLYCSFLSAQPFSLGKVVESDGLVDEVNSLESKTDYAYSKVSELETKTNGLSNDVEEIQNVLDGGAGAKMPIESVLGLWRLTSVPPLYVSPVEVSGADEFICNKNVISCNPGEQFVITGKGSVYHLASSRLWAFTDQQGNVIAQSGIGETRENYTLTAPPGAAYLYCTGYSNRDFALYRIVREYGLVTKVNNLETSVAEIEEQIEGITTGFPLTFLPKKVYGVIGDTMQIFDRGVTISQEPYRFYNDWICGQGKIFERYLEITPESVNGGVPSNLTIKHALINDNYDSSTQITSELVISARPSSPANNINVLCVGASTTANGEWASELKRRLTGTLNTGTPSADGLTNITFVGRKELAASAIRPMEINVEATGGWQWSTFYTPQSAVRFVVSGVTSINIGDVYSYVNANNKTVKVAVAEVNITGSSGNIRFTYNWDTTGHGVPADTSGTITRVSGSGDATITYSSAEAETYCPFYDDATGQPDFSVYAETYCNNQIDVAIFNLSNLNAGVMGKESLVTLIANMKTLLDALHADFPNCKVIIAPGIGFSTYYGLEYNYNASSKFKTWAALYAQFRYAKAIEDFIADDNYKNWCFLANTMAETDSEHVFPTSTKAVNTRVNTTEVIGTNGAHPTLQGYQMIADSIYRAFVNIVLSNN